MSEPIRVERSKRAQEAIRSDQRPILERLASDLLRADLRNVRESGANPAKNPLAAPTTEYSRVVRGGSWDSDPEDLRSARRIGSDPSWKQQDPQIPQSIWWLTDANFVGLRVVRPLRKPTEEQCILYEPDVQEMRDYKEAQGGKE